VPGGWPPGPPVVEGLENAPVAVGKLFTGENRGKLLVRVSPEPAR
jgi:NADPH-dependent curcumin reductase